MHARMRIPLPRIHDLLHNHSQPTKSTRLTSPANTPIFICGPTASGKTSLALETAAARDGEIVNADAFQLLREIDVLSAAPTDREKSAFPHHLFGILEPTDSIDAGRYLRMAGPIIEEIQSRGKTAVVVGGSGLYLKFLTHGPSPLPEGDAKLRSELELLPLDELVSQLQNLDPVEASRTALQNRRYVTRALEICLLSGRKASELRDQWESATRRKSTGLHGVLIQRSRAELHSRIARRTRSMLDGGAIEEVAAIGAIETSASKAIGFREILSMLNGAITRKECEERINAATRQYAKRQETWFRRETWLKPLVITDSDQSPDLSR